MFGDPEPLETTKDGRQLLTLYRWSRSLLVDADLNASFDVPPDQRPIIIDDDLRSHYYLDVPSHMLLWCVGLRAMRIHAKLSLLQLPPLPLVGALTDFLDATLSCVEQTTRDDVVYAFVGLKTQFVEVGGEEADDEEAAPPPTTLEHQFCTTLSLPKLLTPFAQALFDANLPTKFWNYLEVCLKSVELLLEHWDATQISQKAASQQGGFQQPTTSPGVVEDELDIPDLLVDHNLMDLLLTLLESVPPKFLSEELRDSALCCMKLLFKKKSEVCLFSLDHYIACSDEHEQNDVLIETACAAMVEADFFVDPNDDSSTAVAIRHRTHQNMVRKFVAVYYACCSQRVPTAANHATNRRPGGRGAPPASSGPANLLQFTVINTVALLFERSGSVGLYLSVLQEYQSTAAIPLVPKNGGIHAPGGAAASPTTSSATIPFELEAEVMRAIARLNYWVPRDTSNVFVLIAVLVESIRESLHEEYVSLVLAAILQLLLIDPGKETLAPLIYACASAHDENEVRRQSLLEDGGGSSVIPVPRGNNKPPKGKEPMGGTGLFDEEEAAEEAAGPSERAVSFVMNLLQRFPTSDRVMAKAQHLLTLVLG